MVDLSSFLLPVDYRLILITLIPGWIFYRLYLSNRLAFIFRKGESTLFMEMVASFVVGLFSFVVFKLYFRSVSTVFSFLNPGFDSLVGTVYEDAAVGTLLFSVSIFIFAFYFIFFHQHVSKRKKVLEVLFAFILTLVMTFMGVSPMYTTSYFGAVYPLHVSSVQFCGSSEVIFSFVNTLDFSVVVGGIGRSPASADWHIGPLEVPPHKMTTIHLPITGPSNTLPKNLYALTDMGVFYVRQFSC